MRDQGMRSTSSPLSYILIIYAVSVRLMYTCTSTVTQYYKTFDIMMFSELFPNQRERGREVVARKCLQKAEHKAIHLESFVDLMK